MTRGAPSPEATVVSPTEIRATVPEGREATDVSTANPDGQENESLIVLVAGPTGRIGRMLNEEALLQLVRYTRNRVTHTGSLPVIVRRSSSTTSAGRSRSTNTRESSTAL